MITVILWMAVIYLAISVLLRVAVIIGVVTAVYQQNGIGHAALAGVAATLGVLFEAIKAVAGLAVIALFIFIFAQCFS